MMVIEEIGEIEEMSGDIESISGGSTGIWEEFLNVCS
jgi:hypothetical protein